MDSNFRFRASGDTLSDLGVSRKPPRAGCHFGAGFAELPPGTDLRQITLAKPFRQHDLASAVETAMTTPDARRILRFRVPSR